MFLNKLELVANKTRAKTLTYDKKYSAQYGVW